MAIKVGGTTVIDNSRELQNIATVDSTTVSTLNSALNVDPTKGTLTKTFTQNETADITLSSSITSAPVVSATKEVGQTGVSTKGNWDVNSTASNYDFHDTAANVTLTSTSIGYGDLSNTTYTNNYFTDGSNTNFRDFYVKSDGTKMWAILYSDDTVRQYSLSTAYNISTASYDNVNISVGTQEFEPRGLTFKPDGTKFYIVGKTDTVYQYNLSTAFDLSTASYSNVSDYIGGSNDSPHSIRFKPDGTKMFILNRNNDTVYEWALSTAWDITTIGSTPTSNFSITGVVDSPNSFDFNNDGTKVYIVGDSLPV